MLIAQTVQVEYILPAWLLVLFATAAGLGTVLTTLALVTRAVRPLLEEVRGWMRTTDLVSRSAPQWDAGLTGLANAVEGLAEVTRTLGSVQGDIAAIRVNVEGTGEALAEHLQRSAGVWARVAQRLERIEATGGRIEEQGVEAAVQNEHDAVQADRIEHQDDASRPLMGPRD